MIVFVAQIGGGRVDHASPRRIKQGGAGNGGNGYGNRPENHGPQTLVCHPRQGMVLYKPNAAKNHQNRM